MDSPQTWQLAASKLQAAMDRGDLEAVKAYAAALQSIALIQIDGRLEKLADALTDREDIAKALNHMSGQLRYISGR